MTAVAHKNNVILGRGRPPVRGPVEGPVGGPMRGSFESDMVDFRGGLASLLETEENMADKRDQVIK